MKGQGWKKLLRRAAALFCATIALWLLGMTCDLGAACVRLGESSAFVSAALRMELGMDTWSDGPWDALDRWQQLALGQSALLRAGEDGVEHYLTAQSAAQEDENDTDQPVQENDSSETTLPETTSAPEDIQETTLLNGNSASSLGVALYNYTSKDLDVAALAAVPVTIELEDDGPQVLIMHTHGSEAYTMDGTDIYEESDASRTTDEAYNVLRVGDEMQQVFEEMGLKVLHDRTLYDYPQYNGSYTRSCAGVQDYLAQYPSIKIVLDVHRDALVGEDGTVYKTVAQVDGETIAQVMMVIGTDDQGQEHPHWQENLALAIQIQAKMDAQWPSLARPIALRSSRFNQQLTTGSLLVEVGSHGNTLQEAIQGAHRFAQAAGEVLLELK